MQPPRPILEDSHQGRMRGVKQREALPVPTVDAAELQRAHLLQKPQTHPDALPLGHDYEAARPHVPAGLKLGCQGNMRYRLPTDEADVVLGADHRRQLQIMMLLKMSPH